MKTVDVDVTLDQEQIHLRVGDHEATLSWDEHRRAAWKRFREDPTVEVESYLSGFAEAYAEVSEEIWPGTSAGDPPQLRFVVDGGEAASLPLEALGPGTQPFYCRPGMALVRSPKKGGLSNVSPQLDRRPRMLLVCSPGELPETEQARHEAQLGRIRQQARDLGFELVPSSRSPLQELAGGVDIIVVWCHGNADEYLELDGDQREADVVAQELLKGDPAVVLLASCNGAATARTFVASGIPAVLAMCTRIEVEAMADVVLAVLKEIASNVDTGFEAATLGFTAREALRDSCRKQPDHALTPTVWLHRGFEGRIEGAGPPPDVHVLRAPPAGTWAMVELGRRTSRLEATADGPRLVGPGDEPLSRRSACGLGVATDGSAVVSLAGTTCHIAWIDPWRPGLARWDRVQLERTAGLQVLAVRRRGQLCVECVFSSPEGTWLGVLSRSGGHSVIEEICAEESRAAAFLGDEVVTVDLDDRPRGGKLLRLFPGIDAFTALDVAGAGTIATVAAIGRDGDAAVVATATLGGRRHRQPLRAGARHVCLVRPLPGRGGCSDGPFVLTDPGGLLTAFDLDLRPAPLPGT